MLYLEYYFSSYKFIEAFIKGRKKKEEKKKKWEKEKNTISNI